MRMYNKILQAEEYAGDFHNSIYSSEYMPIEREWLHAKKIWRNEVVIITNFNNKVLLRKKIVECIQSVKSSVIEK